MIAETGFELGLGDGAGAPGPVSMEAPLRVAVLGAGIVGRTLAAGWVRAGHHVLLGSRTPDASRLVDAVQEARAGGGGTVEALTHADAARGADVVVLTVPADQVDSLLADLDDTLRGHTVVDTTNALTPGAAVLHHLDALTAAGATAFRAFNTSGWEQMARPAFGAVRADLPYAGPDTPARAHVHRLAEDLGFRAVWLGEDPGAIALTDALARLWFQLAFRRGWGRRLGIRLLTSDDDITEATETSSRTAIPKDAP